MSPIERDTLQAICDYTHVPAREILGRFSNKPIVRARRAWARELANLGLSYAHIGRIMGRDHTTVMYYLRLTKRAKERAKC